MRLVFLILIVFFVSSCKNEGQDNVQPDNNQTPLTIGKSFISFNIDNEVFETGGELQIAINGLPTVLIAKAQNRRNKNETIGIGMRTIDLDTTKLPFTFFGAFGFTFPNADIFIQRKEGDEFILYSMESDGSGNDITITGHKKDSSIIIGAFSGKFIKYKSNKDYSSKQFISETSPSNGSFKILY